VPGGIGTTVRHITQNNTPRSKKTAHKTTQTIKDETAYNDTMQIQLQLQLYKLISILYTKQQQ
jgi:hypothetical protein